MEQFFQKIDGLLVLSFRLHDGISNFLAKHVVGIKRVLLAVAATFLIGIFYPESRKTLGEWGLNLLFIILFLSPLSKIFRMRLLLLLMGFRRQMGILFASLITSHSLSLLMDPVWFGANISPFLPNAIFNIPGRFLLGLAAFTLTLPLVLTSNNWANRTLGANWKRLHWLVYPMFVLAVYHKMFIGPQGHGARSFMPAFLQATLLVAFYGFFKLLAWKNFIAPLRQAIEIVGLRYRSFRVPANPNVFPG